MARAAFNKKVIFASQLDLNVRKKLVKWYLEYFFLWHWKLDSSESTREIPVKFWSTVLEKNGEDQLDRSCESWRIVAQNGVDEHLTYNKKKE